MGRFATLMKVAANTKAATAAVEIFASLSGQIVPLAAPATAPHGMRNARRARFYRLACDYERLPQTLAALHFLAFAILMLNRYIHLMAQSA